MARITFPRVYQVVEFLGRRRGEPRVGSFMPANWDKYTTSRIHTLNMPIFEFAVGKLMQRGVPPLQAFTVGGVFWALVSEAANKVLPGLLVIRDDGALRPMDDDEIASSLGLTRAEWKTILPLLLPGSGVGLLEYTAAELDVEHLTIDEQAQERLARRAAEPSLFDRRESAFCTSAATKRSNEVNEVNEPKRNDRPPSVPAALRRETGGDHKDEAGGGLSACLSFLSGGDVRHAQREFCGFMETLLPPKSGKDRVVLQQLFVSATTLADRYGAPPDLKLIGERLLAISRKAVEIVAAARERASDSDPIRNPLGVLITWARKENVRMLPAARK
ncbi:MAG: hypothetical protein E6Q97_02630 [Desulfurellales bacterium]|nr:MAG: hypothetical protein E6Q97_02630 [Desulfurellales bacterium]